jgi:hypothetical protein
MHKPQRVPARKSSHRASSRGDQHDRSVDFTGVPFFFDFTGTGRPRVTPLLNVLNTQSLVKFEI